MRHQAGERWLEAGRASYAQAGVRADVRPFIEDMSEAYAWADLVDLPRRRAHGLGARRRRASARCWCPSRPRSTITRPTTRSTWCATGAAVLICDRELTAERLARELQRLCAGRGKLLAMAERARLLAKPRAADELAASCLQLARRAA